METTRAKSAGETLSVEGLILQTSLEEALDVLIISLFVGFFIYESLQLFEMDVEHIFGYLVSNL